MRHSNNSLCLSAGALLILVLVTLSCSDDITSSIKGHTWKTMASPTDVRLNGVWGSSPSNVYAVGDKGVILHYDGNDWTQESFNGDTDLVDIWGSSPSNVFAIGIEGQLIHFNGFQWSDIEVSEDLRFYSIFGLHDTMVYIGWQSTSQYGISRFNGDSLIEVGVDLPHAGIWGLYSKVHPAVDRKVLDLWAQGSTRGASYHYNGEKWEQSESGWGTAIWGLAWNEVYIGNTLGYIRRFDGENWSYVGNERLMAVYDIWGSFKTGIFAVGGNGVILYSDRESWNKIESSTGNSLYSVWGFSSGEVYAVGDNGTIIHFGSN